MKYPDPDTRSSPLLNYFLHVIIDLKAEYKRALCV